MTHAQRRYERTVRVNEVVREVLADELERLADPRLGLITVTGVEVTPDLRQATVYYSVLRASAPDETPEETADVLDVSARTVRRDWHRARAYLHHHLTRTSLS